MNRRNFLKLIPAPLLALVGCKNEMPMAKEMVPYVTVKPGASITISNPIECDTFVVGLGEGRYGWERGQLCHADDPGGTPTFCNMTIGGEDNAGSKNRFVGYFSANASQTVYNNPPTFCNMLLAEEFDGT